MLQFFQILLLGNINAPVMMLANIGSKIIIEDLKKHLNYENN